MSKYIINKNQQDISAGGNFEVHNEDTCYHLPEEKNRISLGNFSNCQEAIIYAKNRFNDHSQDIDGCYYCSKICHRG